MKGMVISMGKLVKVWIFCCAVAAFMLFGISASAAGADSGQAEETYTVRFFNKGELYAESSVKDGDALLLPDPPQYTGYDFDCWRIGTPEGEPLDLSYRIDSDIRLHASYRLSAPEFEISSLSFEYDGAEHRLEFSKVTHPLLDGGFLSFDWYKDGISLGHHASSLGVRNVSDSGVYTCTITFSVMGDTASCTTPPISVEVLPAVLDLPSIPTAMYTGEPIYPQIFDTGTYIVDRTSVIHAGIYPIAVTLRDAENYMFRNTDVAMVYLDFEVLRAENFWLSEPSVLDIYTSDTLSPHAISRFGTPRFEFSSGGAFSDTVPTVAGEYTMRAVVDECEDYGALVSAPISFRIIEEQVAGIAVATPADKLKYIAFEKFDPTGLSVAVTYNSGRREIIGTDLLTFSYSRGDSFRFADRGVVITYASSSVLLLVEVSKADYDLSGIVFSDALAQYDGKNKSISYSGTLPMGLDGIALSASVVGGGVNAGNYSLTLEFSTDSTNYNCPPPLYATLSVEPRPVLVEWSSLAFVYDGTAKLPSAYYLDVHGRKQTLTPSGERSLAGSYTAEVMSPDANYAFINPTATFEIAKANYDMSCAVWCGGGEIYNGEVREVFLTSLPSGVSVVGYVNNKATAAGTYVAGASLSYDTANYNPPTAPEFTWSILPASYPTDSFSFSDTVAVFDGSMHFPTLEGKMPKGVDGVALEYYFSCGATHVSEGRVAVEISFSTASTNYLTPESIVRYVQISPMSITVSWHQLELIYCGDTVQPYAMAEECTVTVSGGAVDAGTYTATAVADVLDYEVLNSTCEFTVLKAENSWCEPLSVEDVFFGRSPSPYAVAVAGNVIYEYFTDAECTEPLDSLPTEVGVYYVRAVTTGDKNHNGISSDTLSFSIIAVIPVSLTVSLNKSVYLAFDTVLPSDFTAVILNNDGTEESVDTATVEIVYPTEDSFRYGDCEVELRYADFSVYVPVSVERRSYDMSSVTWEGIDCVYSGDAQYAALVGLPEGVTVREYLGNGNTLAGEYAVSAVLDFDDRNYNAPSAPEATMLIRKLVVPLPHIDSAIYCGKTVYPVIPESPLYTFTFNLDPVSAGKYPVNLTLTDERNCEFPNGLVTASVDFAVEPRAITVIVSDFTLYLFEDALLPSWSITSGELVGGERLSPVFYESDGKIYATFTEANYDVTVIPGELVRKRTLSNDALSILLIIIFALIALTLMLVVILRNRRRIYYAYRAHLCRADLDGGDPPSPPSPTEPQDAEPPADEAPLKEDSANSSEGIDAEYADTAITNSLAKDLIRRDDSVVTTGRRRGIINVDTLSDNFMAGERVDINILKSRSLIPYDTAYIKVLARGIIDKPLFVYANDFSLSAVKMIALKGGRAIKVSASPKIKFTKGIEMADGK